MRSIEHLVRRCSSAGLAREAGLFVGPKLRCPTLQFDRFRIMPDEVRRYEAECQRPKDQLRRRRLSYAAGLLRRQEDDVYDSERFCILRFG